VGIDIDGRPSIDRTSVNISLVCGVQDIEVVEEFVEELSHRAPFSGCHCKAMSTDDTNERSTSFPWRE
jgi:hypothetical protein